MESSIWFHGNKNPFLNFKVETKGNQLPYGVHFTQNKDIAYDFATGMTKMRPTKIGHIFVCKISTENILDLYNLDESFIPKKWVYYEGEKYFDILNEISKLENKNYTYPYKRGVRYHQKYLGQEGYINAIDWEHLLNNAKPNNIIKVLKKNKIKPIIKYPMVGSTDILGYNKVYSEALCVLDESLVEILKIEEVRILENNEKNFSLIKELKNVITENLNKTSKQFAVDNNFFGPVYHGTTPDRFEKIDLEGFKVFIDDSRSGDIRNGYLNVQYGNTGIPAPIHHLGFGVYFTTSKTNFKRYNLSSLKNMKEYYLDVPKLEVINFASPKTMMKWWIENGYDPELAKIDRVQATINLTNSLKEKYDAVWFKGKGLTRLLDGDQVVVFNPDRIYQIDPKLSSGKEIGSKVRATKDKFDWQGNLDIKSGSIGTIKHKQPTPPQANWAGDSKFIYHVIFKPGGTKYNILDDDIEPLKQS